uniref:Uncharacterized protein n=1 Tax=Setaria viridis TaxID=4556 RepID=A0A4U6W7S3_SETVI|nr:hypothetical protein SEVIR_1G081066v2 [Setaria viridis]
MPFQVKLFICQAFQDSRQNSTLPLAMAMMTTIGEPR